MDDFSRSLAAAALIDGQQFTLPGYGTLAGHYLSAHINHVSREVSPPALSITWAATEYASVPTFYELLKSTGATSSEADAIQQTWLTTLAEQKTIQIGDLGKLHYDNDTQLVGFTPNESALLTAYWGNGATKIEPLSKRADEREPTLAPVVPIAAASTSTSRSAFAKTQPATKSRRRFVPLIAASLLIVAAIVTWTIFNTQTTAPDADKAQVVAVNQERLNRSPYEAKHQLETASVVPELGYPVNTDDLGDAGSPANFDPAALAGTVDESKTFTAQEIEAVIIVGSFGNSGNAARLTERIASDGHLPYVDQQGRLTRVGITFLATSENDIAEMMQKLRTDYNVSAWLLE